MRKKNYRRRAFRPTQLLLLSAVCMVALVLIYSCGRWIEHRNQNQEIRGNHTQRYDYDDLIEVGGETYRRKKDITTVLLMGIDRKDTEATQGYRNGGQADFLRIIALDSAANRIAQIQIDRDTMTPITVLGVLGNKSGVRTAQVSLSHGFGDGREQSCELTVDAVSNLMMGIPIDFYIALNMDGISVLNDSVGGVTVTLEDDFSAFDPAMTPGTTLKLAGDQAEIYVRSRKYVGIGSNEARMKRQERYISELVRMLDARIADDEAFVEALYDALGPYMITNFSKGRLINEVWAAKAYERSDPVTPEGMHQIAEDGFMQFHADEAALEQMVFDLFYEKVSKTEK